MSNEHRTPRLKRFLLVFSLVLDCSFLSFAAGSNETATSYYQAGLAYERLGRLQEAYTKLQLACVLEANDSRMALALGIVAVRLGREDVAKRELERSITLDANSAASYYQLALLYEKQKAADRALDSWNRFLELNPDETLKLEARKHIRFLELNKAAPVS